MDIVRNNIRPIIRSSVKKSFPSVKINDIHFACSTSLYMQLEQVTYIGEIIGVNKEDHSENILLEIVTDDVGRTTLNNKSFLTLDYFLKNDQDSHVKAYLTGSKCEVFESPWWNLEVNLVRV